MRTACSRALILCVFLLGNTYAANLDTSGNHSEISGDGKISSRKAEFTEVITSAPPVQIASTAPLTKKTDVELSAEKLSPAVERSVLGVERAKLLSEMNKSPLVGLPSVEYLEQFDPDVKPIDRLSLFDALALSLSYSNDVASSSAHRDSSESLATASLGPLLPHIDLHYSRGQESSSPSSVTQQPNYDRLPQDTHTRTDTQLSIRQTLFDLPSYFERQRQNLLLQASEHNLSNTQERVVYDTSISFLKLIQYRLAVVLTESYEGDLKKLLEYMNTRVQAGGATKADMQRVKGRVLNASAAVIEAKGAYESGLVEFKRLSGVVPSSVEIPVSLLPILPKDFMAAMTTALESNFELQAAKQDMEAVVQEKHSLQGKFIPKFDIEISATRTYNAGGISKSDPPPNGTLYPLQNDRRAMLVMNWNIFNGGADLMQSKALEAKRQEYEYRASEIQRRLEESLRINFNALRATNGRIIGVKQEMESNDIVLAAFNEQLFAANRSLLDVLDAYQRQFDSRTELTRLLVAEATAGLQLLRNIGKLQEAIVALR